LVGEVHDGLAARAIETEQESYDYDVHVRVCSVRQ
jgi:hypothetical protein